MQSNGCTLDSDVKCCKKGRKCRSPEEGGAGGEGQSGRCRRSRSKLRRESLSRETTGSVNLPEITVCLQKPFAHKKPTKGNKIFDDICRYRLVQALT